MYRLGIDLGGTNIVAGVVDENYKVIGKGKVKTNAPRPAEAIADDMAAAAFAAIKEAGVKIEDIAAMGIGTPGSVDPVKGMVKYANNLQFRDVELCRMMKERTGVDFYLENDANAAAYGEFLAGAGKKTKDFIAVTLGTGVGGGIIIDGKIFSGSNFAGGELGHTVIAMDGEPCSCGRHGCWEAYASATALIRQTKKAMKEDLNSEMWKICGGNIDNVNGLTAFDAWRKGDGSATRVVNNYFKYIAVGIADMINIFQPELVCIGGGISNEKENLTRPVNELVKKELYGGDDRDLVVTAELGNDAGIIGAAFLDKLH